MTKLEPTRTSSDLTATERLRSMLDERGLEWRGGLPNETIITDPIDVLYVQRTDGTIHVYIRSYLTPEQAVAATLGDVPCLPHWWTHDGTLHVELPKLPESISVRLPDQRDREVGSARTWQYTRDNEMCHVECFDDGVDEGLDGEPIFTSPTWYLSCGHTTQDSERPNFCPVCGKVVNE